MDKKVYLFKNTDHTLFAFWCPGCKCGHGVPVLTEPSCNRPKWDWNGSEESPSLTPSLLTTYNGKDAGQGSAPPAVCHLYLTNGTINFLPDSTHALAGQSVGLEPF